MVVFVRVSLWTLRLSWNVHGLNRQHNSIEDTYDRSTNAESNRLTDDVFACVLAFEESLEVVVIPLTASVVEELTGASHRIVPVSSDRLLAVSKTEGLRADGFWTKNRSTLSFF